LHQNPIVYVALIETVDELQELIKRCRRRQPLDVGAQPRLTGRFELAADIEL